ncbi:MAG TPA: hypothetical protein VF283_11885 [Bryobacteraceae bacterium]
MAVQETSAAGTLARRNIVYFPVVPGRIEFAARVRRYLLEHRPQVVAVELPSSLEKRYTAALGRLPQMSVIVVPNEDEDAEREATYIPVEPADPFVEALRTARELEAEGIFLEPPTAERPHLPDMYPEPYAIETIGLARYIEEYRVHPHPRTPEIEAHAAAMAWKLQGADPLASVCVVVSLNLLDPLLDAMEKPQEEPPQPRIRLFDRSELFNLHPDCLAEVTSEAPYYQERYETLRAEQNPDREGAGPLDRPRWQLALLRDAEREYAINTGDRIASWQRLGLAKFARNLAILDAHLIPSAYDLALAARSLADDNYGYEVWQMANRYSAQQTEDPRLETLNISGEEVWLRTRKIRIRRRLPRMKQMLKPAGLKGRKKEKTKGEWARATKSAAICSYPPEDFVIETYGRFVKRYAKSMISEERSHVEQFATSTLDGIDLRETIRNWHEGKLYVRELGKTGGDVGALVIIFDEDRENRYDYLTTWLGEHQNESDMAFYSTPPFAHIVGPGIGRAEYGGLLMTLPPRRMYDVWGDSDYDAAETKAERLLMAALDYSMEHHVVYAARKPPRSKFRQLASRLNRKIVYVPLGQLSPAKLKKIRVVHVLDGYERREQAKQYLW